MNQFSFITALWEKNARIMVYIAVAIVLGLVAYSILSQKMLNQFSALSKEKRYQEYVADSLQNNILKAELAWNKISSFENIVDKADSLGLSFHEPVFKVYKWNPKHFRQSEGGLK